jgi:hypothetical protein
LAEVSSSPKRRPTWARNGEATPALPAVRRRGERVEPIVRVGVALAAAAAAFQTAAYLVNAYMFDYGVQNLDADSDANAFTWATTVTTFTAAQCAVVLGLLARARLRTMLVLGAVLAWLSLDDLARLHEHAGGHLASTLDLHRSASKLIWPLLMLPLMATAALLLFRLAREAGGSAGRALLGGLALLVAAIVAEIASAPISNEVGENPIPLYVAEVAFEEAAELAGWVLIAAGLCALAWRTLLARAPD